MFAGLCALNGAFVAPVARLTTESADPLFVAAGTTLFAGFAAALVLAARGRLASLTRDPSAKWMVLLGLLGTVLPNLLFFFGTSRTSALDAVLCLQIEPVYALLLAWRVLGHRLTFRRVASAAILMLGIAMAVGGGAASADPLGLGLLLCTPLAWQVSHILVLKRLVSVDPERLTAARYIWGGLLLCPVAALVTLWPVGDVFAAPSLPTLRGLLPMLAIQGVVLFYAGTNLWYQSIARLDLARATSIVVPSIPLLSFVASFLIVGEVPSIWQVGGMVIAATGVLSFVLAPHAIEVRERVPTPTAPIGAPVRAEAGDEA
jgi:O-acetylserine/cysteine efflux transporter